jgi:iron complex transport system substrate-binding protein
VVARLVVAAACACLAIHRWGPVDLLAIPERPFAYGRSAVSIEGLTYPRYATGADGVRVRLDHAPRRIVSQDAHADEYLYAVVPPARVVGVSETAYDGRVSNLLAVVERYRPAVATDPERVLRLDPDLVVAPASARAEVTSLLRHAGLPVYRIYTMFETLDSIEAHIRLVGYLTGEDDRAAREIRRFQSTIARAVERRPVGAATPEVLGLGGSYTYGAKTLFADILRVLGAENVAARHGLVGYDRITDEHIVRWDPAWIVAGADRGGVEATRARLLANPAIAATRAAKDDHLIVLEHQVFQPLSPFTAQLVEALSQALYGGTAL